MTNISVIIASYNKLEQLKKVISSLRTRLRYGDELIIVDDGSGQETVDYIKNLDSGNVETYRSVFMKDMGYRLATARNEGIKRATNNCIIQIDDDYLMTGNIIEKARELYDPDKLFIFRRDEMEENGDIIRDKRLSPSWKKEKVGGNMLKFVPSGNPPAIYGAWGMFMYSKERAKEIGMYNEEYNNRWGAEDADFSTRFLYAGYDVLYYVGERCVHLDHEKRENRFDEREENEEKMKELLRGYLEEDKFSLDKI